MNCKYISEREESLKKKIRPQNMKPDFEEFWRRAVEELRSVPLKVSRRKMDTPYDKAFTTWEVTYNAHDGTEIVAWFSCPTHNEGKKLPCAVWHHGGNMKKVLHFGLLAAGICSFAMDVRSQGGVVVDRGNYDMGDVNGTLMTRGILNKEQFYMRNIYLDAIRAVDAAATMEEIDPEKIVTIGGSQGGALSIVASALSGRSKYCFSNITSYCCLDRRTELGSGIFGQVSKYLKEYPENADEVFDTLTYFDINNMVSLLKVPVCFTMGLADPTCLPEFVYSAYSHVPGEKEVHMYPFVKHTVTEAQLQLMYRKINEMWPD